MFASIFLLGGLASVPQPVAPAAALVVVPVAAHALVPAATQAIADDRNGGVAAAVNRVVGGIISYVSWPGMARRAPLALCQVGNGRLTQLVRPDMPGAARQISSWSGTVPGIIAGQPCDIIYIGRLAAADHRRLIDWARAQPVLTVTDDDPGCAHGAMLCLAPRGSGVGFSLNIDAVARSGLRIDPRVLQLGHATGAAS